ncbi:LRR and NB-ARC domain disease resistance protein [Quillaja saponaria]|uniref:LRR and NB-ARC domain disease resistance protein n=1 Tax=Quillaja saponaria TaxID=32244 RepID=A0AAD7PBN9_QUISA|nr:LRR and NB-ARC domain disease resistance protein [Quillaja saponaria]
MAEYGSSASHLKSNFSCGGAAGIFDIQTTQHIELLCMVVWGIWKARSNFLFQQQTTHPRTIEYASRAVLNDDSKENKPLQTAGSTNREYKITLLSINAVLDDAEEKQIRNQHVKKWVDELKDAVFDAEDLLDEIDTEVSLQELEAELTSGRKYSGCCIGVPHFSTLIASTSVNSFNKDIESKIHEVLDHLKFLAEQKDVLGLKSGVSIAGKWLVDCGPSFQLTITPSGGYLMWTWIRKLPDSICRLYNLQTFKLNRCYTFLGELPKDMHKLVNLRHFDFSRSNIKAVPHIGRLQHLQGLTYFKVGKHNGTDIKQLGQLNQLRGSLPILNLQNVIDPTEAMQAKLKEKKHIEELKLEWRGENEDSEKDRNVLEMLQPHKNLKKLSVINYGGTRFPDWIGDCSLLSNVVYLELRDCKYCFSLPPLGQLLSLKELGIFNFDVLLEIGPGFYFQGNAYGSSSNNNTTQPFRSLEILSFEDMKSWEEWCCWFEGENDTAVVVFPCLMELHIWNCSRLKGHLPRQLPSLKIFKCQQLVASLPSAPDLCVLILESCEQMSLIDVPSFPFLKEVFIDGSREAESLLTNTTYLEELKIKNCNSLSSLTLDLFPLLSRLVLINCHNLESLSASSGSESESEGEQYITTSLTVLKIESCPKFVSLSLVGEEGSSLNLCAPILKYLKLHNLENLKVIAPTHVYPSSISFLSEIMGLSTTGISSGMCFTLKPN